MSKKSRHKHRNQNNRFLSKPSYQGLNRIPTSIQLIQYNQDEIQIRNIDPTANLQNEMNPKKNNWFRITGISDVTNTTRICQEFGLHSFDIKELITGQQLVKVVEYGKITFILVSSFEILHDSSLDTIQIAFIVGSNFIVSFEENYIPLFDDVITAMQENNVPIIEKGADYLLCILLNAVNSMNTNIMIKMEDQLSDIEDKLIMRQESIDLLHFLHVKRVDYRQIKRFMVSFREEYNNLQHNSNKLIKHENKIYFDDLDDKLRTSSGRLEDIHESLISLLDLYYNNNNMKMNEIMKRLTVVSTIFIPLTFFVGVWGMNFKFMPELDWKYGYIAAWGILISIACISALFLKKKKWF